MNNQDLTILLCGYWEGADRRGTLGEKSSEAGGRERGERKKKGRKMRRRWGGQKGIKVGSGEKRESGIRNFGGMEMGTERGVDRKVRVG